MPRMAIAATALAFLLSGVSAIAETGVARSGALGSARIVVAQAEPNALSEGGLPRFAFSLDAAPADAVARWSVDLICDDFEVERRLSGEGPLPSHLEWDGTRDGDKRAPVGSYRAVLNVDFGGLYQPTRSTTRMFSLAFAPQPLPSPVRATSLAPPSARPAAPEPNRSKPSARIVFSANRFSPTEGEKFSPLVATIEPEPGSARIESWELTILDPAMHPFAAFSGKWPEDRVVWEGRGLSGKLVESCSDYAFVAVLHGPGGLVGEARASLSTGVVLLSLGSHYTISVSSITFRADSADYLGVSPEQSTRNSEALRLLARKLKQYPDFSIRIEGHAVQTEWRDPARAAREQRESLIPLSKARAAAIRDALAGLGIERGRMTAVGVGAEDPVVPDSDEKNRWKNRRVAFYLERIEG